ncbi:MAG TPA: thioredoxin [Campylobacterales bacterium]|nr:thioredoxin [Campylobacterales bacterium]
MSLDEIRESIKKEVGVLLYFSTPTCNVCKAVEPKLKSEFKKNFPLIKIISIDSTVSPEISADFQVFSAATTLLYLDGKEFAREGRNISIDGFIHSTSRVYKLLIS